MITELIESLFPYLYLSKHEPGVSESMITEFTDITPLLTDPFSQAGPVDEADASTALTVGGV